jgi:integrase
LRIVRTTDRTWVKERPGRQPVQLAFVLPGAGWPANRRPTHDAKAFMAHAGPGRRAAADDPGVCPPALVGQLGLFLPPVRRLGDAEAARVLGRDVSGHAELGADVAAYATEHGLGHAWRNKVCRLLRLVLAARDADGETLVPEDILDGVRDLRPALREILRRSGQLAPRRRPVPRRPRPTPRPRSCRDCGCWGMRSLCSGCRSWRRSRGYPLGQCRRCRHSQLPLQDGLCRCCTIVLAEHGEQALHQPWTQLWFGGLFALRLKTRAGLLGYQPPHWRVRDRALAARPNPPPISAHLVDPRQGVLFDVRRDWSRIAAAPDLPTLTPGAAELLAAFRQQARQRRWNHENLRSADNALRFLLGWLGADAPIPEEDIRSLSSAVPWASARRALVFLTERDLVIPNPEREISADQRWIDTTLAALPAGLASDIRRWVAAMRGHGRRGRPPASVTVIRNYLGSALPVLVEWDRRGLALREITSDEIRTVLARHTGTAAQSLRTALRCIFGMLKQERVVFRDPTRGIKLAAVRNLPTPVPNDRLLGLIDRIDGAMGQLIAALVAVHALHTTEIRTLVLSDLDASAGTLIIYRASRRHTIYLEDFSHRLVLDWVRFRHHRWPMTTNPHLFLTDHTAYALGDPPIANTTITTVFRPLGLQPHQLRRDRILNEASVTADPIHLMRLFGISARTAMRYVHAAHPERRTSPHV